MLSSVGLRLSSRTALRLPAQRQATRSLYAGLDGRERADLCPQHKSGYVHTKQPGYNVYFPILMGWQAFLIITVLGGVGSLAVGSKEGMAWLPVGSKKEE